MGVGWFEIYVENMDRATQFYQQVFEVALEDVSDVPDESHTRSFPMTEEAQGATGALVKADQIAPAKGGTVVYFEVEDCVTTEARVEQAGGVVVEARKSIGPYGFMSMCQDTEGNLFGLHAMT